MCWKKCVFTVSKGQNELEKRKDRHCKSHGNCMSDMSTPTLPEIAFLASDVGSQTSADYEVMPSSSIPRPDHTFTSSHLVTTINQT